MDVSWKWENIRKSSTYPSIRGIYSDKFPEIIRELLARFLEANSSFLEWNAEHPTADELSKIFTFTAALATELQQVYEHLPVQSNAEWRYKELIYPIYRQLKENLRTIPYEIFKIIFHSIHEERRLVKLKPQEPMLEDDFAVCTARVEDKIHSELESALHNFSFTPSTAVHSVINVGKEVIDCLRQFRDNQRFTPILVTKDWNTVSNSAGENQSDLSIFEEWFMKLSKCIAKLTNAQLKTEEICDLEKELIANGLVVEKHPRQVIRTDTAAGKVILRVIPFTDEPFKIVKVSPSFLNGEQAGSWEKAALLGSGVRVHEMSTCGTVTYSYSIDGNVVTVDAISVTDVSRRTSRNVLSELFYICFQVTVEFRGELIDLYAFSLPISVTSNNSQEPDSWPYIVWNNAFSTNDRPLGSPLPEQVSWQHLVAIIDQDFIRMGSPLTTAQKDYFKSRLIKDANCTFVQRADFTHPRENGPVLCKTNGQSASSGWSPGTSMSTDQTTTHEPSRKVSKFEKERNLSIGAWIGYCVNILNPTLKNNLPGLSDLWRDGKIIGFMDTREAERILQTAPIGSFLIKFPEQIADRLAVYFPAMEAESGEYVVKLVFSRDDMRQISLEERLSQNNAALYLYSNYEHEGSFFVNKKEAFHTEEYEKIVLPDKRGYFPVRTKVMDYFSRSIMNRVAGCRQLLEKFKPGNNGK